jgi:hypothetical protein
MSPDRKAALRAECDEFCDRILPDELTPAQQIVVEMSQACWGGTELTPAMERWAARQLHLPPDRWKAAVEAVLAHTLVAKEFCK